MSTKPVFFQVRETFLASAPDGSPLEFHKGEVVDASDPALKKWPENFEPLVVRNFEAPVEQATAAPGEKRGV